MNATIVHAVVIVVVVAAATVLRALSTFVYGAALGFAGARATTIPATTTVVAPTAPPQP